MSVCVCVCECLKERRNLSIEASFYSLLSALLLRSLSLSLSLSLVRRLRLLAYVCLFSVSEPGLDTGSAISLVEREINNSTYKCYRD